MGVSISNDALVRAGDLPKNDLEAESRNQRRFDQSGTMKAS